MEKHKLDSLIKNKIKESNDFYDSDAQLAKERIWSQVKPEKKVIPLFYRLLAVASILLLLGLSVMTFYNVQYKSTIDKLVESNTQLKLNKQNFQTKNETVATPSVQVTDTVYVEKTIVEIKPVITTKYITDTVYLKQIVYADKSQNGNLEIANEIESNSNSIDGINENSDQTEEVVSNSNTEHMTNENSNSQTEDIVSVLNIQDKTNEDDSFQKDIIIKSDEVNKNKKSRKFKIKFGGNRSKIGKETLALQTKI
jgi:hypothetical protein